MPLEKLFVATCFNAGGHPVNLLALWEIPPTERANLQDLLEQFLPSLIVDIDNLTGTFSPE
jgi:hypothetical protein